MSPPKLAPLLLLPLASAATNSTCTNPVGFANHQIRAPLPNNPTLQLKMPFLLDHLIFMTTVTNLNIPQSSIASFCLEQCVGYVANASAGPIPTSNIPPSFTTNRTGPCLSFTVDQGVPYPPSPNDTALRWYCEGYDVSLAEDLSDYEPVNGSTNSYHYAMAVNRDCSGTYRAF